LCHPSRVYGYNGPICVPLSLTVYKDTSLYLNQIPDSAMAGNNYNGGSGPGGSYCWVVGSNGWVFSAYRGNDGYWYSGFNGAYP
jgi:hypothetical protein